MRRAVKSASSSLRMAGVWDQILNTNLNPRVSFMLSPPFRWTPALRRPEQNFWKLFDSVAFLAPKSPKISKHLKNWTFEFQLKFWIDVWTHLFKFGLILELEISQKSIKNRTLNKKWQKSKNLWKPQFLQWFSKVRFWNKHSKINIFNQNLVSEIVLNSCSVFCSI